jgi:hypothetical protein
MLFYSDNPMKNKKIYKIDFDDENFLIELNKLINLDQMKFREFFYQIYHIRNSTSTNKLLIKNNSFSLTNIYELLTEDQKLEFDYIFLKKENIKISKFNFINKIVYKYRLRVFNAYNYYYSLMLEDNINI